MNHMMKKTIAWIWLLVSFFTSRSQELKIDKIIFDGNQHFKAKFLKSQLGSREKEIFNEALLENDLIRITDFYASQGFLKAKADKTIQEKKPGHAQIRITIQEGVRTRIAEVGFSGIAAFKRTEVLAGVSVKPGNWLINKELRAAEDTIATFYKNSGYPYIEIHLIVDTADTAARVAFIVNEGKLAHIKDVQVWGNKKVAAPVILTTTEIRPGERFSLRRIYDAQRRLYATGLFDRLRYRLLGFEEKKDSLVLSFDVHEQPPHTVGFGLGFETPNRLLFSFDWEHLNLLNQGQVVSLSGEFSPDFYGEYIGNFYINYRVPYILRTRTNFNLRPFFNREVTKDSTRTKILIQNSWGAEAGMSRDLSKEWRLYSLGRYKKVIQTYTDSTFKDSTTRGTTNSLSAGVVYDIRNDPFNPRKGVYLTPVLEAAGGLLKGDNDFYRMTYEGRCFYSIFALRVKVGVIIPYGRTSVVPTSEEFSLGGGNSLRGYKDKSIGPVVDSLNRHYGDFLVNTNFELRSPFYKNFGLVLFFDGGEITTKLNEFNFAEYEYSTGVGLRYNTPIGPVRIDYGRRLKNPKPDGWGIYLGLFQVF
jgi:outer membrane protein assembly complex protein YaeT